MDLIGLEMGAHEIYGALGCAIIFIMLFSARRGQRIRARRSRGDQHYQAEEIRRRQEYEAILEQNRLLHELLRRQTEELERQRVRHEADPWSRTSSRPSPPPPPPPSPETLARRRLGLPEEGLISFLELRAAYREAVKRHHPDRGGDPRIFIGIQQAYEFLQQRAKSQ